jgi:rare lipoprotein A
VIDLSYAAAVKLGIAAAGTGEVEVERITTAQIASGDWRGAAPVAAANDVAVATPTGVPAGVASARAVAPVAAPVAAPAAAPLAASNTTAAARGWSVQLGAFAQESNAEALAGRTAALLAFLDEADVLAATAPRVERDGTVYRVLVGGASDRESAQQLARELERVLERPATVVAR